jgi:hypothetical protein
MGRLRSWVTGTTRPLFRAGQPGRRDRPQASPALGDRAEAHPGNPRHGAASPGVGAARRSSAMKRLAPSSLLVFADAAWPRLRLGRWWPPGRGRLHRRCSLPPRVPGRPRRVGGRLPPGAGRPDGGRDGRGPAAVRRGRVRVPPRQARRPARAGPAAGPARRRRQFASGDSTSRAARICSRIGGAATRAPTRVVTGVVLHAPCPSPHLSQSSPFRPDLGWHAGSSGAKTAESFSPRPRRAVSLSAGG